jgi:hypothetical protein
MQISPSNGKGPPSHLIGPKRQKNKLEKGILGAPMHKGRKVVHVPRYWQGLWAACQSMTTGTKLWIQYAVECE